MKDLLQKLVDVNVNQPLTLERIFLTFTVTFFMGLLILLIYKLTYKGVLFNRTFGTSLLMVAMVTSLVIMPISSNVVLSLGMVGALSIVQLLVKVGVQQFAAGLKRVHLSLRMTGRGRVSPLRSRSAWRRSSSGVSLQTYQSRQGLPGLARRARWNQACWSEV